LCNIRVKWFIKTPPWFGYWEWVKLTSILECIYTCMDSILEIVFPNCVSVYPCSDFMWTMFLSEKWLEQNLWEEISPLSQWHCMQQYGMHLIGLPMEGNTGWTTSMHPMLPNSLTLCCMGVQWIQLSRWPSVTMIKVVKPFVLVLHQHKESKWRVSERSTWHTPTATTESDTKHLHQSVSSIPKKLIG